MGVFLVVCLLEMMIEEFLFFREKYIESARMLSISWGNE